MSLPLAEVENGDKQMYKYNFCSTNETMHRAPNKPNVTCVMLSYSIKS
jgi:hypothetical protein